MTKQSRKYHLSLAGEFHVAGQLQRLGVSASVTYGNAKNADVIAFGEAGDRAVVVEVKSTSNSSWVVGGRVPEPSSKPWVFVHFPQTPSDPPSYYVLLQSELHALLKPAEDKYFANYEKKHGKPYGDKNGVVNLKRIEAAPYLHHWHKITDIFDA